ncbi:MAG: hypothetical protein AB1846_09555 [Chloroflexota bacterium]
MISEDRQIILRVVEQYARTGIAGDEQVKVTCLPDNKTSYVEHIAEEGRSIMLDEFRLDGKVIWAGYSRRSGIVYLSNGR